MSTMADELIGDEHARSLSSIALALADRATEAAPGLTNAIAIVTATGAWRVLGGSGDMRAASALLKGAAPRLQSIDGQLMSVGSRCWVLPFGGKGAIVGCALLMADHERTLPEGELEYLARFGADAEAVLAAAQQHQRTAQAHRWRVATGTLPRRIHGASSQADMLAALGPTIEQALPSSQWAVVLRGVGRQLFQVVASGPDDVIDAKPFVAAARRAVELERVDVACPGAGEIVAGNETVMLAGPLRDRRMRCIGAIAIRVAGDAAVGQEPDAASLELLCDTFGLGLDLAEQTRAMRILRRHDPETGLLSLGLFRDEAAAFADACTIGNKTAAMILLHAEAVGGADDDREIPPLLRRFADEEAATEIRIARLGAWRYAILAADQSRRDAVLLAARLRWHLRTHGTPPIAGSAGIAMIPEGGSSYEAIVAAATAALDEALATGAGEQIASPKSSAEYPQPGRRDARRGVEMLKWLADLVDETFFAGTSHSAAVAARSREIALWSGTAPELVDQLTLAGRIHDIGRALLPQHLFLVAKPTTAERRLVQTHVVLGARLVAGAGFARAAECIAHMHERWDGTGEPKRLTAGAIPLGARILAVANAFETVLAGHGRGECGLRAAIAAVAAERGRAFDPDVVDALLASLREQQAPREAAG